MSFMWEIKSKPNDPKPIKNEFSIEYAVVDEDKNEEDTVWRTYTHNFIIVDYQVFLTVVIGCNCFRLILFFVDFVYSRSSSRTCER